MAVKVAVLLISSVCRLFFSRVICAITSPVPIRNPETFHSLVLRNNFSFSRETPTCLRGLREEGVSLEDSFVNSKHCHRKGAAPTTRATCSAAIGSCGAPKRFSCRREIRKQERRQKDHNKSCCRFSFTCEPTTPPFCSGCARNAIRWR